MQKKFKDKTLIYVIIIDMKEYTCVKCSKIFNRKSTYDNHINRKTPCDMTHSTKELAEKVKELEYQLRLEREKVEKKDLEIMILKKDMQIMDLENKGSTIGNNNLNNINSHNINTTNNNNSTNNTNNTTNNTLNMINNFGKENTDFITSAEIGRCLLNGLNGNADLFELIHYNPEYPENNNVKMKKNSNTVLAFNDGKWVQSNKTDIAKFHLTKATDLYSDHLSKKADSIVNVTDDERTKYREMTTLRDERYTNRMKNLIVDRIKKRSED